jgi:hypothetical protein
MIIGRFTRQVGIQILLSNVQNLMRFVSIT